MKGSEARDEEFPSISEIDRTIHEPARLMIMAHLFVVDNADFLFLQRQTGLTGGNLSSHLSKLEDAGYINARKEFLDRKPHTVLQLTSKGRIALQEYRQNMKPLFKELPE